MTTATARYRIFKYYGRIDMEGGGPQKIVTVANLGNYKAIEDWWFILPAIWFVDTVVMFLARFFPQYFGKP